MKKIMMMAMAASLVLLVSACSQKSNYKFESSLPGSVFDHDVLTFEQDEVPTDSQILAMAESVEIPISSWKFCGRKDKENSFSCVEGKGGGAAGCRAVVNLVTGFLGRCSTPAQHNSCAAMEMREKARK